MRSGTETATSGRVGFVAAVSGWAFLVTKPRLDGRMSHDADTEKAENTHRRRGYRTFRKCDSRVEVFGPDPTGGESRHGHRSSRQLHIQRQQTFATTH